MKKICALLLLTILATGCGYTRKSNSMSSAPVITALMPNGATAGQAFNLTVNGSNFTSGSVIYWSTTPKNDRLCHLKLRLAKLSFVLQSRIAVE